MSRKVILIMIICCLFLTTGCVFSSGKKEMPDKQPPRTLTIDDIKKADASFLDEKPGAGDKQAPPKDPPKPLPPPPTPPQEPAGENKAGITQGDLDDSKTIYKSAPPPPPDDMKTEKQSGSTNQELAAIKKDIKDLQKYSKENRNRIGKLKQLVRRINPDADVYMLAGYQKGQVKPSPEQIQEVRKEIIEPLNAGLIKDPEIRGFEDYTPPKKGSKYTLGDFAGTRAFEIRNLLLKEGIQEVAFSFGDGGATDEFGENRSVVFIFTRVKK
jgi:hypothetical protein